MANRYLFHPRSFFIYIYIPCNNVQYEGRNARTTCRKTGRRHCLSCGVSVTGSGNPRARAVRITMVTVTGCFAACFVFWGISSQRPLYNIAPPLTKSCSLGWGEERKRRVYLTPGIKMQVQI